MNHRNNFHDIYLENYYSPFPREKSNREALKYSYAKKLKNNKTIIDIPPSVTLSYMNKNPLYFDIKKHNNRVSAARRPKTAKQKFCKSSTNFYTNKNKNTIINNCLIYDNKKLEQILNNTKNKFIAPRNKLNKGCELVPGLIYKPMNPRPTLTPEEALRIINKINFPSPPLNGKAAFQGGGRAEAGTKGNVSGKHGVEAFHLAAALDGFAADAEDISCPGLFRGILFLQTKLTKLVVVQREDLYLGRAVYLDCGHDSAVYCAGEHISAVIVCVLAYEVDAACRCIKDTFLSEEGLEFFLDFLFHIIDY